MWGEKKDYTVLNLSDMRVHSQSSISYILISVTPFSASFHLKYKCEKKPQTIINVVRFSHISEKTHIPLLVFEMFNSSSLSLGQEPNSELGYLYISVQLLYCNHPFAFLFT